MKRKIHAFITCASKTDNRQVMFLTAKILKTATSVPVRMDWSMRIVVDIILTIRMSAGILSPTASHHKPDTRQ